MTCRTCLTLNPPGAPACVRCNTPLEPAPLPAAQPAAQPAPLPAPLPAAQPVDATVGAKQIGPGLAGPVRAAPGSSRAAAAAVQPPGYDSPGDPARPAGPRAAQRRVAVAGLAVVALVLAGGGAALWLTRPSYLDTAAVAGALGTELTARLGGAVAVTCPAGVRSRAGETFSCTARDAAGTSRTVTVTLLDDAGRYRWELGR